MATYRDILANRENKNWVKASLALKITKEGLCDYVTSTFSNLHQKIYTSITHAHRLPAGASCHACQTENLVLCPSRGLCSLKSGQCSYHDAPNKSPRPCPANICGTVRDEIVRYHRNNAPTMRNTRAHLWSSNPGPGPWEIAKCYMPYGYTDISSFEETDLHGVIRSLINCEDCQKGLSFQVGTTPNLLSEVHDTVFNCQSKYCDCLCKQF